MSVENICPFLLLPPTVCPPCSDCNFLLSPTFAMMIGLSFSLGLGQWLLAEATSMPALFYCCCRCYWCCLFWGAFWPLHEVVQGEFKECLRVSDVLRPRYYPPTAEFSARRALKALFKAHHILSFLVPFFLYLTCSPPFSALRFFAFLGVSTVLPDAQLQRLP